jgi:hypothetical protein
MALPEAVSGKVQNGFLSEIAPKQRDGAFQHFGETMNRSRAGGR